MKLRRTKNCAIFGPLCIDEVPQQYIICYWESYRKCVSLRFWLLLLSITFIVLMCLLVRLGTAYGKKNICWLDWILHSFYSYYAF